MFSLSLPMVCTSVSKPLGVAVNQCFLGSHWDHSWNQRGLPVTMGKSQAAIQSPLHQSYVSTFFFFNNQPKDQATSFQHNQYFSTIVSPTNQMNCRHSVFWSCGLQCMLLMYCSYVLCNIHVCRTQLPAVRRAGPSCPCRYRVSPLLRAQSPSSWMLETCMWLPAAAVVFSWWPPLIKICPNSS